MLDHPIIDVALGLIFFYVVLSLVASAVQEWIAAMLKLRANTLRLGVENLIGDKYVQRVYEHPLIKNLGKRKEISRWWNHIPLMGKVGRRDVLPSYIDPETMSMVILEVIAKENGIQNFVAHTADDIRQMITKIEDGNPLKGVLISLIDDGEQGAEKAANALKKRLAGWFDEGMTRVAGWYKRKAKVIIFLIAFLMAAAFNASSIHMAEELWRNDALRTSIATQAQVVAAQGESAVLNSREDALSQLESFPIGWEDELPEGVMAWAKLFFGWLITTAAVSLGAPFWFDLLGKVANLRGSGGKAQIQSGPNRNGG